MRVPLFAALAGAFLAIGGPAAAEPGIPGASAGQRCHPSYPDFCIPPPPPDLDCGDIAANRKPFRVRHDVRSPDPHRFDRDRDGRACEPRPKSR
jgi:micrococcal nuclease